MSGCQDASGIEMVRPLLAKPGQRFHSVVIVQRIGVQPEPIPLLILDDGMPSETVLSYCVHGKIRKSALATKKRTAHSIGLLYDYYTVSNHNSKLFGNEAKRFLNKFNDSLVTGTIEKSSTGSDDISGLWWRGVGETKAQQIRYDIEQFIYYIIINMEYHKQIGNIEKIFLDSVLLGTKEESKFSRSPYSFFTHLSNSSNKIIPAVANTMNKRRWGNRLNIGKKAPVKFPLDKRLQLVIYGSVRKSSRLKDLYNYVVDRANDSEDLQKHNTFPAELILPVRRQLSSMLLLFSGARGSEISHLLIQDVVPCNKIPQQVIVSLTNPDTGLTWMNDREVPRRDYLWERFRLRPLTQETGARYVGWKGLALDDARTQSSFLVLIATPKEHQYLRNILRIYTELVRPLLVRYPTPYLLLTKHGDPMKPANIRKEWNSACGRIGVYGCALHSPRHMIGDLVRNQLNLGASLTQKILHHRTVTSQAVYTIHDPSVMQLQISKAYEARINGNLSPDNIAKGDLFIQIDPEQLFSDFLIGGEICQPIV